MPASAWPVAVLTLAGLIAGLASEAGLTGRVQVDFSPTLTTLERMSGLVRRAYAPQLAALESAFSRFRDAFADTTGRRLPDTLVSARWDPDQGKSRESECSRAASQARSTRVNRTRSPRSWLVPDREDLDVLVTVAHR